jgi:hypothetical protein
VRNPRINVLRRRAEHCLEEAFADARYGITVRNNLLTLIGIMLPPAI